MPRFVLSVIIGYEVGEGALAFLTNLIEPQQLEMLTSLLDEKKAAVFH